jgi:hypothetical protein
MYLHNMIFIPVHCNKLVLIFSCCFVLCNEAGADMQDVYVLYCLLLYLCTLVSKFKFQALCIRSLTAGLIIFRKSSLQVQLLLRIYKEINYLGPFFEARQGMGTC